MRKALFSTVLLLSTLAFGQVGINNENPQSTLDVTAKTTDGSKPEGIIAPRLTGDQIKAADVQYTALQVGAIVYASSAVSVPSAKTANINAAGYYYFDGLLWQKMTGGGAAGDSTNDAWINDASNTLVKLGTNSDGITARTAGTDFVAKDNGAVGIGTSSPAPSALLDITSSNKGLLAPRVALKSATDQVTVASPATGLLVYNLGTETTFTYKGYVFWNGSEWRIFSNASSSTGSVGSLVCDAATFSPGTYTSGTPYSGTLSISYTGGNGGVYPDQTVGPVNGLTAKLAGGNFATGSGTLNYAVTGTPTVSSPTTTTFPISIGGSSCNVTVGGGNSLAIGEAVTRIYSVPATTANSAGWRLGTYVASNSLASLPVIDGLQMDLLGYSSTYYVPIIENTNTSARLISFQTFATQVNENRTRLNINVQPCPFAPTTFSSNLYDGDINAGWFAVDNNQIVFWNTSNAEVETTNLQVQIDANTYRWYEFKWWCMEIVGSPNSKKIFMTVKRIA